MDDINIVVRFRLQEDRIMKNLSSNLKLKDQIWKTITEHAVGCLVSLRYHGLVAADLFKPRFFADSVILGQPRLT